jgi:hypothetical protein
MYNENSLDDEEGVQEIWLGATTWAVGTHTLCDEQKVVLINCNPRLLRRPYSIHYNMKKLLNNSSRFDITIKWDIEGREEELKHLSDSGARQGAFSSGFSAHSVILSLRCPMLAAALNFPALSVTSNRNSDLVTTDGEEGEEENKDEDEAELVFHRYPPGLRTLEAVSGELVMELGDVDRRGGERNVRALLNYLYCGTAELTPDSVMFYLHVADQYSMRQLLVLCKNYLIRYLDHRNVCHILSISEPYMEQLVILKAAAIHMIVVGMEQGSIDEAELSVLSDAIRRDIDFLQVRRAESRRRRGQM